MARLHTRGRVRATALGLVPVTARRAGRKQGATGVEASLDFPWLSPFRALVCSAR